MEEEQFENQKLVSLGSGFIIDKTGYIVRNYHVIAEAAKFAVKLSNGSELEAKVIGQDRKTDLALLKINYKKLLPYAEFSNSEQSKVGDWVIAIGNLFALGITVTYEIILANCRDITSEGIVDNFTQTDVAINRGNSMFNIQGKVIGVNTAILSPSGRNIGIGFATPSSIAKTVIEQLKSTGKVRRGMLGIRMQMITEDIAEPLSLKNKHGALVVEVIKGSAAEKAGVKVGDIITSFNNNKIKTSKESARIVGGSPIGQELTMSVLRNGRERHLNVTLIENEEETAETSEEEKAELPDNNFSKFSPREIMGGKLATLNSELRQKFNLEANIKGVIILNLKRKSVWYSKCLRPGDVILSANQVYINWVDQ